MNVALKTYAVTDKSEISQSELDHQWDGLYRGFANDALWGVEGQMPARTEGLPDVYVFKHKETQTYIVQLATGRSASLWRQFTSNQIPGTNCLAMAKEDELEQLFSACDGAEIRIILNGC